MEKLKNKIKKTYSDKKKDGFLKGKQSTKTVGGSSLTRFDRVYRRLGDKLLPETKRIDMVLIHPNPQRKGESLNDKQRRKIEAQARVREEFEKDLRSKGFIIEQTTFDDKVFTKLHCPFKMLCIEAESVNLEMPLKGLTNPEEKPQGCLSEFIYRQFVTDKQAIDYISARFMVERIHLFENYDDPSNFFRPSVRTLLVDHILINMNIKEEVSKEDIMFLDDDLDESDMSLVDRKKTDMVKTLRIDGDLQKLNFPYMKKIGVYSDKLILHEASEDSRMYEEQLNPDIAQDPETPCSPDPTEPVFVDFNEDPRRVLNREWTKLFKFQPLTKIRNYFGEKIAFYFAWSGTLITSLWIPMLLGLAIFIFGIVKSAQGKFSGNSNSNETSKISDILTVVKEACDNEATPYYALIICVWGTLFLEIWKRKTATLAYEWDVDEFEATEPDRPEFYGTKQRIDPVTDEEDWYYPMREQLRKFLFSGLTLVFMLCLVLASVVGVIIYRVIATIDYCEAISSSSCLMVTTVASSLLNTISILILSKIYEFLARKLTDWENHRTQTLYDDALIVKLFAFQFANNYASCFYIAFFRGRFGENGIVGLGPEYVDDCVPDGNCMSELSFQILTLIIAKPLPKFFSDVVLPFLKRLWRKRPQWCCKKKVEGIRQKLTFVQKEAVKPSLGDFTMGEYTEKVIQYGFLMLFAASLPIAPLIVLLTLLIDIRVDAKRMLWWYRRPLATIAQDIGTWHIILEFVNICGVISNGFLLGFTSSWGRSYSGYTQLWIVLGFEVNYLGEHAQNTLPRGITKHIVFTLKFIVAYLIPDVPAVIQLASRKNMHHMGAVMRKDREALEKELAELIQQAKQNPPTEKPSKDAPNVYTENQYEDDWRPVEEENLVQSSPKQKRRRRVDEEPEENYYEEVENTPMKKLKKKKKKKKHHHHHHDDRKYDEEDNYEEDAQNYMSSPVKDTERMIKIKGPQGQVLTELPVSDRTAHSSKRSDDSSFIQVKGPRGEFITEIPYPDSSKRHRRKRFDDFSDA